MSSPILPVSLTHKSSVSSRASMVRSRFKARAMLSTTWVRPAPTPHPVARKPRSISPLTPHILKRLTRFSKESCAPSRISSRVTASTTFYPYSCTAMPPLLGRVLLPRPCIFHSCRVIAPAEPCISSSTTKLDSPPARNTVDPRSMPLTLPAWCRHRSST